MVLGLTALVACIPGAVRDHERPALLTIRDLGPWGPRVVHPEADESFSRTAWLDGSYDVEYEFLADDSSSYLLVTIEVLPTAGEAAATFRINRLTLPRAMRLGMGEVSWRTYPGTVRHADDVYFAVAEEGSLIRGQLVIVRRGRAVYTVFLAGVILVWPSEWDTVLSPKLLQLEAFPGLP